MTEGLPQVARVEPGEVTPALVTALYTGAVMSPVDVGVVALTGPGAVTSFQGLLTNDIELPGEGSFVYGALLTPKGMIVVDGWAARLGATVGYTVPAEAGGRDRALAIFTRSVPPRLARVTGRTRAEPHPRGLAASGCRSGREDHPPRSAPRRDRRRVVHERLLHRAGDGRAAALPRPRQPPGARPAVRSRAARRPRRGLERGHPRRSRRRAGDQPGVRARDRGRRCGTMDRPRADPARGGARLGGARVRPRRARRRPPLHIPDRRAGMTVLVTGASGLVGSHVVEALVARGETVRALVRPSSRAAAEPLGAEAVAGDVTDPAVWQRAAHGVRAIVHAAAIVQRRASWERYVAVNVEGTRLAAAAARAARARLVHISSVAVYGGSAAYPSTPDRRDEDFPFQPIATPDYYARSKRMAEDVVREAATHRDLDVAALRPNVIYGERDRLFTPRVIGAVRLPFVPQIGPGTNRLSCVYAGNVAAAAVLALEAPLRGFRAYNVTSDGPPALSQREFFAAFAAALGRRYRPVPIPSAFAGLVIGLLTVRRLARAAVSFVSGEHPYSDDRIRAELQWRPLTPAPEAIRRTVAWFLENEKPGH